MERLIKPVSDGGAPYLNQDFFQYLQQNHITSYSAFLDEINDVNTGNCGIIIKGVTPSIGVSTFINDKGEVVVSDLGISYQFNDSLVYLDGDFLEPAPWIATYSYPYQSFYIVKVRQGVVREVGLNQEDLKIRRYTKVYDFLTDVIQKNYFEVISEEPPIGTNYIRVFGPPYSIEIQDINDYGQVNYTHLDFLKTNFSTLTTFANYGIDVADFPPSRYLDRIMRYYMAEEGEIYQTYDVRWFDTQGLGFGEMAGFHLVNNISDYNNLSNSYTIGYSTFSNSNIQNLTTSTISETSKSTLNNYNKVKNLGGSATITLSVDNLPFHYHGINNMSGTPSNNLSHTHFVKVANKTRRLTAWQNSDISLGRGSKMPPYNVNGSKPAANGVYVYQPHVPKDKYIYESDLLGNPVYLNEDPVQNSNLQDHVHLTDSKLTSNATNDAISPINNLPKSINIAYYVKI